LGTTKYRYDEPNEPGKRAVGLSGSPMLTRLMLPPAVDLAAGEEEHVDAALAGAVE